MITRRFLLAAAAVTAASSAIPKPIAEAVAEAPKKRVAFIVGSPGDSNWHFVRAPSAAEAIEFWKGEDGWVPECDTDDEDWDFETCVCGNCGPGVEALRMEQFDKQRDMSGADWLSIGWDTPCDRCGYPVNINFNGVAVGSVAVCTDCQTVEEYLAAKADGDAA